MTRCMAPAKKNPARGVCPSGVLSSGSYRFSRNLAHIIPVEIELPDLIDG